LWQGRNRPCGFESSCRSPHGYRLPVNRADVKPVALAAGAVVLPTLARAQPYPARPVKVVVPVAPGGVF